MEDKQDQEDQEQVNLTEAVSEIISVSFRAISLQDANASDFYSTEQISEILDTRFGEKTPRACINAALEALSFRSRLMGGKYYWVMRKV